MNNTKSPSYFSEEKPGIRKTLKSFDNRLKRLEDRLDSFPVLFTKEECATILNISVRSVERLMENNRIDIVVIGTRKYISEFSLKAYLSRELDQEISTEKIIDTLFSTTKNDTTSNN